jgi:uncharacterized SAM-binding protein YcdF (DUF218 family)
MFFVVSKILWFLAQPVTLVFVLLVLALLLNFRRRRLLQGLCLGLAALILGLSAYTSLGYVALLPLEQRFERPAPPAAVTGIIVLGGGMDTEINAIRLGYELNRSGDRFVEALRLAQIYPEAKILISGGSGALFPEGDTEAAAGARFFRELGIDPARIIEEDGSRNTDENVQLTKALVQPQPGDTWLLVTSAFHMPRSVGIFRKAEFPVTPWPTDYFTSGQDGFGLRLDQPAEGISVTTRAMREWIGLVAYWASGRTTELFPGP